METSTAVRVFLGSPMDLVEERQIFRAALENINSLIGKKIGIRYEVIGWEDDVVPGAGIDAQDVVNRQIRQDYDIFVGLFRNRIGSRTHRSLSGTVEEYELAQMKRSASPETGILCYFLESEDGESPEITALKQRMSEDGVLYVDHVSVPAFRDLIFRHFSQKLLQLARDHRPRQIRPEPAEEEKRSVAVAVLVGQKVILVQRSRKLSVGPGTWQIPGGKVEGNEPPAAAAQRELQEELNLDIDPDRLTLLSAIPTKNLKNNKKLTLLLYTYPGTESLLSGIALNRENEAWELVDLAETMGDSREYLGLNRQLMAILWRELFFAGPLEDLLLNIRSSPYERLPKKIGNCGSETSNLLYAFLSALGLIRFAPEPVPASAWSERIIEQLISMSRNNTPVFEDTNVDRLRELHLPNDEFPVLQRHRERMLFSHQSLMSVLSCKAPLKNSVRNVADVLIFGEHAGKKYLLLRWDFYAEKYQLVSGGVDVLNHPSAEEKATEILTRRFSDMVLNTFDYQPVTQIRTHHFSAGSVDNDPILREYRVDVIAATPKNPQKRDFLEFVATVNAATELSVDFCWDISREQIRDMNCFQWCSLDDLLSSSTCYQQRSVRGFQEILSAVGRQTILNFAARGIALSDTDLQTDIDALIRKVQEKRTPG